MILAAPLAHASEFEDGMQAYRDKDYGTARLLWLPLAESGHTFAMNNVGMMYKKGYGVPRDYKKAVKYFKKSSDQGFSLASYNLAAMYQSGKGVKKNRKLAFKSMLKAAEKKICQSTDQSWSVAQNRIWDKEKPGKGSGVVFDCRSQFEGKTGGSGKKRSQANERCSQRRTNPESGRSC